jgi:hypothetical protein
MVYTEIIQILPKIHKQNNNIVCGTAYSFLILSLKVLYIKKTLDSKRLI